MPANGAFYLGKLFDIKQGKLTEQPIEYDPADLTTHAVVTGMTGSGKTGLCVGILEEAALQGIPAIIIDPKGDLTNLLLHFPDLLPADFQPWIDPDTARREGKDVAQVAVETAERWKKGLADWGLGREQLLALKDAVDFGVYTPGSSSGTAVNILSSFAAPEIPWQENREILREKISSIVTALLGLVGISNIDPLRSREHILLSNILETAWSSGKSLDLTELILQTQKPTFDRLGAFPLDSFFPEKDRFDLAMLLNNFLASPSFETWREGQPLDVAGLLYTPQGKPRHSIFYMAHLSESERMFFVTLLFASVETWMRSQRGTSSLRAILYFDEIMGYLPPIANPPSRTIMLRMLKQARAFGVGLLLATQNPVDVDYKGLSNAGTWIIGRLQTDQDKQRLLDGLESAGGQLNRRDADQLISNLGKRTFLLHNVHEKAPQIFQTRWALNFLAGPLTRSQIPELMRLVKPSAAQPLPAASAAPVTPTYAAAAPVVEERQGRPEPARAKADEEMTSQTRPAIPAGVEEYFIPNDLSFSQAISDAKIPASANIQQAGFLYRPALFAQAQIYYLSRKHNLDYQRHLASLPTESKGGLMKWDNFAWNTYERDDLVQAPLPQSRYAGLPGWLADAKKLTDLQKDFIEWVYRSGTIRLKANETLKVYANPEVSTAEFREQCSEAARQAMQAELDKVETAYEKKLDALEIKVKRQEAEVENQKDELEQRRMEELGTHGELLLSMLSKRKKSVSSSLTKRRMTAQAKSELQEEQEELELLTKQLEALEKEQQKAIKEVQDRWAGTVNDTTEVPLAPMKKDIYVEVFGIAWLPYYLIEVDGQPRELPAFAAAAK